MPTRSEQSSRKWPICKQLWVAKAIVLGYARGLGQLGGGGGGTSGLGSNLAFNIHVINGLTWNNIIKTNYQQRSNNK